MRKLTVILISLILCFAAAFPVFADDLYQIDPITGEIVGSTAGTIVDTVKFSSNCVYSMESGTYTYVLSGGQDNKLECSVFDGMVVTESVMIRPLNDVLVAVYKDGEPIDTDSYSGISAPGTYIVREAASDAQILKFTITNSTTGSLYSYNVPAPFSIYSVRRNGVGVNTTGSMVDFTEEGNYSVEYGVYTTKKTYSLDLVIDHTPPVLEVTGVENGGTARDTVTVKDDDPSVEMTLTRNGEPVPFTKEIKQAGNYVVTATDKAGNSTSFYFTMQLFFDANAWWFIALFSVVAAAVAGYLVYCRKHMVVR